MDKPLTIQKQPPRGVLKKKVFWKYAANLQENTHSEVRFQYTIYINAELLLIQPTLLYKCIVYG